jgi:prepilin-type N-terminal cleavage/methylation domain-containing protein
MFKCEKYSAFTLVELLVVISIVGLLSTIVLVITSGLGEQANIAKTLAWSRSMDSLLGPYAVGMWNLDENPASNGTQISDISGWNNHGTLVTNNDIANKSVVGVINNALDFDGSSDYVNFPISIVNNLESEATFSFWVKPGPYVGIWTGWLTTDSTEKKLSMWRQSATAIYFAVDMPGAGTQLSFSVSQDELENKWHHYVMTITGSRVNAYWDGKYKTGFNFSGVIPTITTYFRLGIWAGSGSDNSVFDDVRVYSIPLTASQVWYQYYAGLDKLLVKGLIEEREYQKRLASK